MFKRLLSLLTVLSTLVLLGMFLKAPPLEVGSVTKGQSVTVQAKQPALICPGPAFINGGANGVTLGSFTQSGDVSIAGKDGDVSIAATSPSYRKYPGTVADSKGFHAIQTQIAESKTLFGLTSTNCVSGANQAWLVAGDNSVGREALLILANPTPVDATVSLQLYGTNGPIEGSGLSGISAPAEKVTVLPLAAFAPKTAIFSVQVSSRGAELGIWLQQKTVRGLTPGGLDLVSPTAFPAKSLEIPGILLRTTSALASVANSSTDVEDAKPILRLTSASGSDAHFTAQVQGADGSSFGTVIEGTVPANSTKDFDLPDLTDGNYAVHVDSDVEVVGAVRYSRMAGSSYDFTWSAAVTASKLDSGFSTVKGVASSISVVNPNKEQVELLLNGATYKLAGNSNQVISLSPGSNYSVTSTASIAASVVVEHKVGVGVFPVIDFRGVGGQVKVTVR